MKYAPYPSYKHCPVEWLEKVPFEWEVMRLKLLIKQKRGAIKVGPFGSQIQSGDMLAGEIKVYNQRNVLDRDIISGDNYISIEKFNELKSFEVSPGDLLITTRGTIGRCVILPPNAEKGILHPCLMRIQLDETRIEPRYIEIVIQDSEQVIDQLRLMSNATTIDVIYSESLKEVWLPIPPLNEQRTIADFLDRETAKLDTLMAKKRELIEKLKEKRMALISHTVTRGLPPDAARAAGLDPHPRLKASGIEWLGGVPEHWQLAYLKRMCLRVTDGAHISPDTSSEDYPFVSTVDISDGEINFSECLRTSIECYEYLIRTGCKPFAGDVLFSKDGTVGKTAVIDFDRDFVVASSLVLLSPKPQLLDSHFLNYWLNNSLLQQEIELLLSGAALRRISVEKISNLLVVIPPLREQRAIANYLLIFVEVALH